MRESKTEYKSLGEALHRHFAKMNNKRRKHGEEEFSQRQAAKKIGVSPEAFKKWYHDPNPGNIQISNLYSLISFLLREGGFEDGNKEEQITAFWLIATTRMAPDEGWIKEKILQQQQSKEDALLENEELDGEIHSPIDTLTRYLPDAVRQPVENFLDTYLVGTKDQPALFGGREADLEFLNDWLNDPQPRPSYLLLYAPAGRGKSALLAHWASQLASRQDLTVIFLPISLRFSTDYENFILRALAGSLASLHGDTNIESFIYKSSPDELKACITRELKKPLQVFQMTLALLRKLCMRSGALSLATEAN